MNNPSSTVSSLIANTEGSGRNACRNLRNRTSFTIGRCLPFLFFAAKRPKRSHSFSLMLLFLRSTQIFSRTLEDRGRDEWPGPRPQAEGTARQRGPGRRDGTSRTATNSPGCFPGLSKSSELLRVAQPKTKPWKEIQPPVSKFRFLN